MSKAFVKESGGDEDDPHARAEAPAPTKNYITPAGFARLDAERRHLVERERPEVVRAVSAAAANGDRSENADYLYGKKRLREIDRRVRFLIKRLESASVVDNAGRDTEQVFFGATVQVRARSGEARSLTIVGADEVDAARGRVSWLAPVAAALLKARAGDETLEILDVSYPAID